MRFRYDQKYLGQNLLQAIADKSIVGGSALIAYSDHSTKDQQPMFLPCRYAHVQAAERVGTTVSIDLRLNAFAFAKDLEAFKTEVESLAASQTPRRAQDGSVVGLFCVALNSEPKAITESPSEETWELFVSQIAVRPDFTNTDAFVLIRGIFENSGVLLKPGRDGRYSLQGNGTYSLRLYQYHPSRTPVGEKIEVTASGSRVAFISNPLLVLDSRYDHKDLRFEVAPGLDRSHSFLQILIGKSDDPTSEVVFDLTYDVPLPFWRTLGFVVLTASLLTAPTLAAVMVNVTLSHRRAAFAAGVGLIANLAVAVLAIFKLRRVV